MFDDLIFLIIVYRHAKHIGSIVKKNQSLQGEWEQYFSPRDQNMLYKVYFASSLVISSPEQVTPTHHTDNVFY
jgi:hypothetical protein